MLPAVGIVVIVRVVQVRHPVVGGDVVQGDGVFTGIRGDEGKAVSECVAAYDGIVCEGVVFSSIVIDSRSIACAIQSVVFERVIAR